MALSPEFIALSPIYYLIYCIFQKQQIYFSQQEMMHVPETLLVVVGET